MTDTASEPDHDEMPASIMAWPDYSGCVTGSWSANQYSDDRTKKYVRADLPAARSRKKVCYVGVPAIFKLELACQHLSRGFGDVCYLVGSALERPDWRDIDIVMIMSDENFAAEFPDASSGHWEFDPKWLIMTVAKSDWLSAQCGHLVDFKFQQRTHANQMHKGPRNAMGLVFTSARQLEASAKA